MNDTNEGVIDLTPTPPADTSCTVVDCNNKGTYTDLGKSMNGKFYCWTHARDRSKTVKNSFMVNLDD